MSTLSVHAHLPGRLVPGTLSTDHATSSHGHPVLVMEPGGSYPRTTAFGPGDVTDHGLAACLVLEPAVSTTVENDDRSLLDRWNRSCAAYRVREPVPTMVETFLDAGGWSDGSVWAQGDRHLVEELDALPFESATVGFVSEHLTLATRMPEGRQVEGLEYGAHMSGPGWSGYYVRPEGGAWAIARQTPAEDELLRTDEEIVARIRAEVDEASIEAPAWTFPDGSGVVAINDVWDVFDREGRATTGRVVR